MCDNLIGKTIGNFRLLDVLGQGGMGCVYKALDQKMDRLVALKVIRHTYGVFSAREGQALGQLNHPNIVNIFYMDESDEGDFIVMEYVQGHTLQHYLKKPVPEVLTLLKQSLLALEHAHEADIVHRDIKPSNIMVTDRGVVKVMDFGLAKIRASDANRTVTRLQAGTINYMSPEQVRGLHHVDHRSDLYSLGKAFYEIFAGRLPYETSDSDPYTIMKLIVEVPFKPPSHFNPALPPGIDRIIMKALEKDPNNRYQDARAMLTDVKAFEQSLLQTPSPPPPAPPIAPPPSPHPPRRRSLPAVAAAVLLLVTAAFGLYAAGVFTGPPPSPPAPQPVPASPLAAQLVIASEPPDAEIRLDDTVLGRTPSDTLNVTSSEVRIRLSKPEFQALDTTLAVTPGRLYTVHLTLRRSVAAAPPPETPTAVTPTQDALLSVVSTPPGADVRVDGVALGSTPLADAPLSPGPHRLDVRLDGHQTHTETIELDPGANPPLRIALEALGRVVVSSNPPGAVLSVDDRRIGPTPIEHPLPAGRYRIAVSAEGFSTYSEGVDVAPGAAVRVDAELDALMGTLRVLVNPFGAVYVDGTRERGEERGWFETRLPWGRHVLRATHPGFGEWEKEIDLTGELQEVRINFLQEKRVNITSGRIRGAAILIDGQPTGFETPSEVPVRVGRRRIAVQRAGYSAQPPYIDVLIEGDEPEPLRFVFELEQ